MAAINRKWIGNYVYLGNTDRYWEPMYVYVVNQKGGHSPEAIMSILPMLLCNATKMELLLDN